MFSHTRYKELLGLRTLNRYERTPEWYNKLAAAERPLFLQDVATDWMKDWVGLSDDEKKPFVAEAQKKLAEWMRDSVYGDVFGPQFAQPGATRAGLGEEAVEKDGATGGGGGG